MLVNTHNTRLSLVNAFNAQLSQIDKDELRHIQQCPFYKAKWEDKFMEDCQSFTKYLVAVDYERRR